jgi:hypothetical protein
MRREHRVIARDSVEREDDANDARSAGWGEQIFGRRRPAEYECAPIGNRRLISAKRAFRFPSK